MITSHHVCMDTIGKTHSYDCDQCTPKEAGEACNAAEATSARKPDVAFSATPNSACLDYCSMDSQCFTDACPYCSATPVGSECEQVKYHTAAEFCAAKPADARCRSWRSNATTLRGAAAN